MHDVLLVAHRVVATDGTRGSLATIGDTTHLAHYLYGIHTTQGQSHHRRSLHRGCQRGEEGFVGQVGIVLTQDVITQLHHLHA